MALRGLSSPQSARGGLTFAMAGMGLAIVTTLMLPAVLSYGTIILGLLIGGIIGAVIARHIYEHSMRDKVVLFDKRFFQGTTTPLSII